MLVRGILNPQLNSLLARVRHTNTLVIADRAFPFWPEVETVDLALIDDVPTVTQVLEAVLAHWQAGRAFMAAEFAAHNEAAIQERFTRSLGRIPRTMEPHAQFKLRVPHAIGLIRTGDTTPYANVILESA
jgi:D-ribose pyranase